MHVDITKAADAYGLTQIPAVVLDDVAMREYGSPASFSKSDWSMLVNPDLMSLPLEKEYDQRRFAAAGAATPLNRLDSARFILAHELWHAVQDSGPNADQADFEAYLINLGLIDHDTAPSEIDADKHAAKVYPLVEIEP